MSCILNSGYIVPSCKDQSSGVSEFYVTNFVNDLVYGYSASVITSLTGGTPSYFKFEQEVENAKLDSVATIADTTNQSVFFTNTLDVILHKLSTSNLELVKQLVAGRFTIIVKDSNAKYWILGTKAPARVTKAEIAAGQKFGDMNGSTLTFTALEPNQPIVEIAYSAFSAFLN